MKLNFYSLALANYDKQNKALKKVKDHLRKTVATAYHETCLRGPDDTTIPVAEQYLNLRNLVGTTPATSQRNAGNQYEEAVKRLGGKPPKNLTAWITT